jgi:hypothetical protein
MKFFRSVDRCTVPKEISNWVQENTHSDHGSERSQHIHLQNKGKKTHRQTMIKTELKFGQAWRWWPMDRVCMTNQTPCRRIQGVVTPL